MEYFYLQTYLCKQNRGTFTPGKGINNGRYEQIVRPY